MFRTFDLASVLLPLAVIILIYQIYLASWIHNHS